MAWKKFLPIGGSGNKNAVGGKEVLRKRAGTRRSWNATISLKEGADIGEKTELAVRGRRARKV